MPLFFVGGLFGAILFPGKRVAITGGSRGLGLAIARRLACEGASLAILARDDQEIARAKFDLVKYGGLVTTWQCDVTNESDLQSVVKAIGDNLGGIDVLINNAGEIVVGPLLSMTRQDFENALSIHFWAPFSMTLAALPYLKRQNSARIANIASFGRKVAVPHLAPYCVSKFAMIGLSDSLRAELASERIKVTTVAPGLIREGKSALTITFAARFAVLFQALFPNFTGLVIKFVSFLLPGNPRTKVSRFVAAGKANRIFLLRF